MRGVGTRGCHEGSLLNFLSPYVRVPPACSGVYLNHRLARAGFLLSDGTGVLKGRQIAVGKWAAGGGCMGMPYGHFAYTENGRA